jgi:hypothetical protein
VVRGEQLKNQEEKRTEPITVYVSLGVKSRLKRQATLEHKTLSTFVADWLEKPRQVYVSAADYHELAGLRYQSGVIASACEQIAKDLRMISKSCGSEPPDLSLLQYLLTQLERRLPQFDKLFKELCPREETEG